MELAALSLKAESKSLTVATEELKDLSAAAKGAEAAADSLAGGSKRADSAVGKEGASARKAAGENKALGTEARTAAGSLENMATGAGRASGSLDRMAAMIVRGTVGLVGMAAAAMSVTAYQKMADSWSDMQSVVGAAIKDMEAAPPLMSEIVRLANASYSPLEQTARGFALNATTLRELGKTQQEMLDYTEAVNNALVINAARGENAAVVQNALNRALATGKLQATEYEVIMSRSPRVLEAIAQEMGTTVASLRQLGSEGKITGDIITSALLGSLEDLRAEAALMPAIVADAFTRIQTNTLALVGSFDQAFAVSERFAGAILALADGIGALAQIDFASWGEGTVKILTTLGQVALVLAATRIPALIVATKAMTVSFVAGIASINGVSVALVASAVATRASAVAMGVGAAAARGFGAALAFAGGPLGLLAAGVAALGVVFASHAIASRNAANEMREFESVMASVAQGAQVTEEQLSRLTATQALASIERQSFAVRTAVREMGLAAYEAADIFGSVGLDYAASMLAELTSQFEQGNISIFQYKDGLNALGATVPGTSTALSDLIDRIDQVVEGTEGVMRGEAVLRYLQKAATEADLAMLGLSTSTQAAADATSNLTTEQQKAIDTAQQMASEYSNRSALAQIEVQYGKDSAQYMAEQLSQQRALTFARIDALDIAERDRQALRDSYDQMIANEAAAQGWAVSVGNVNVPLSASYDWLVKIRDTQPDGTWLGTAIQRAATLATNLWDAVTANRSLSVEPAPGMDTGNRFFWVGQTVESLLPPAIAFREEVEKVGGAANDAAKELDHMKDAADGIKDSIDPMRAYNRQLADMQKMVDSGFLSKDEMAKGIRDLNVELVDSLPLVGELTDALVDGLFDGFKNGLDGVLDVFKNWLKQMVLEAAKNQIVLSMGATTGAAGSAVGSVGGGILGSSMTGVGALMGGVSTGLSSFMTTGLASLGPALSGATASLAGFGAAIGALALPLAGVVAAFSFFSKKTKQLDAGVRLTVNAVDTMVETFNKTETSRFWGLSKKTRTSFEAAEDELANPIVAAVSQIQSSIVNAAASLGVGANAFDGFARQITISTKGMTEEQAAQAIQDTLSGIGEQFAAMIPNLARFSLAGEAAMEAVDRLSTALSAMQGAMSLIHGWVLDNTLASANLGSVAIMAAGGMDSFAASAQTVFTQFYSAEYQLAKNTANLSAAMAQLGLQMPQSRDGFVALLRGIDVTTESGAALYGQVLSLASAFDQILPSFAELEAAERARVKAAEDQWAEDVRRMDTLAMVRKELEGVGARVMDYTWWMTYASEALVSAAGGTSAFSASIDLLFTRFHTAESQLATTTAQLTREFGWLGLSMPKSRDEFAALLRGIDTTTVSGAALYGQLLSMAAALDKVLPTFEAVQEAAISQLTSAQDALSDLAKESQSAADGWERAAKSIGDWIDDRLSTSGNLVSASAARAFNESQYQITLARAMAGDADAADNLASAADNLLASVNATARTGLEAARAEARILAGMTGAETAALSEAGRHAQIVSLMEAEIKALDDIKDRISGGEVFTTTQINDLTIRAAQQERTASSTYAPLASRMSYSADANSASLVYAPTARAVTTDNAALLAEVRSMREEVAAFRSESRSANMSVSDNTRKTVNRLETALREGMPVTGLLGGPVVTKEAV